MPIKKTPKTQKMDGLSADVGQEKLDALKQLVPEIFSDGKIDAEKLKRVVGENNIAEDERYRLDWAGKSEVFDEIAKRSACTLTLDEKRSSKDWAQSNNVFIEGENLEVLRMLQKAYHGKVKMIYIDPPYNTGNDFVYNDNFRATEEEYCDDSCNVDENGNIKKALKLNSRDNGRFHSNWMSMMYPRLYLAKNLLKEDGVIFASIDDNEVHNLRMIMSEIFGEENFIVTIARKTKLTSNKGNFFAPSHEYIHVFAKSISSLNQFNDEEAQQDSKYIDLFKYEDDYSKYNIVGLYQPSLDSRPNQRYYIECPDGSFVIPPGKTFPKKIGDAEFIKPDGNKDKVWRWSYESYLRYDKSNLVFKKTKTSPLLDPEGNQAKWNVYTKIYLKDRLKDGARPVSFITKYTNSEASKELIKMDVPFDFSKPKSLIKYLMKIQESDSKDYTVLDFFAGSGTTAHAVMSLNADDNGSRKYICIQMPEETADKSDAKVAGYKKISDIAIDRIKKASTQIKKDFPDFKGDLGVRVYKETDSNFPQWHARAFESDEALKQAMIDYSKTPVAGSVYDRAIEVLLKLGYPLTTPLEEKKGYFTTPDGIALVLDSAMNMDGLKKVLSESPKTIVVLEKLFKKDEDKINFGLRCKESGVIFQTI